MATLMKKWDLMQVPSVKDRIRIAVIEVAAQILGSETAPTTPTQAARRILARRAVTDTATVVSFFHIIITVNETIANAFAVENNPDAVTDAMIRNGVIAAWDRIAEAPSAT